MDSLTITFNKNSSDQFNSYLLERPPYPKPERDIRRTPVDGRNGTLTEDLGAYKDIEIPCRFGIFGDNMFELSEQINAWLDWSGELIFSHIPNRVFIVKEVKFNDILEQIETTGEYTVVFVCEPFKYDINNDVITFTTPITLLNPTTAPGSQPIIKVYGSGSITLTINSKNIYLYNVVDYVTIDCVLMDAYKDTVLKNNDMLGNFKDLFLIPGENTISWTGTVTKIEVVPNFRYL